MRREKREEKETRDRKEERRDWERRVFTIEGRTIGRNYK